MSRTTSSFVVPSRLLITLAAIAAAGVTAPSLGAQTPARDSAARADSARRRVTSLGQVTITATRTIKDVFDAPAAVSVIDSATLHSRLPNTPVDQFRDLPGLDVTGVGTNQARPSIRGLGGQRILLLEDGLRLNNSRRQQDFGELPAIAGITGIDRVEVVRGPASVLYGTDAIGGVVNVITAGLPSSGSNGIHGWAGFRYSTADKQQTPSAGLQGRAGPFAFRASGAYRDTRSYDAPSGTFGDIRLADDVKVNDTGVRDYSYNAQAGLDLGRSQSLFARAERYTARRAGFGYVANEDLGATGAPSIQITYPDQDVSRYSLGWRGLALGNALADRVEVTTYLQNNTRHLNLDVFIPFGGRLPPTAGVTSTQRNWTDLQTLGFRAEATKLIGSRVNLTYGADAFRDRSNNTDSSVTVVTGFGPPQRQTSTRPQIPNATFRSGGLFAQSDIRVVDRLSLILGARVQDVLAKTRETPNLSDPLVESKDRTAVGTANVLVRATTGLNLIASVGRGFRSPNLVERFFEGATPEGSGYQRRNLDLDPETSVNVDLGARWRRSGLFAEAFVFQNDVRDGIAIEATGDSVNRLPAYRNVNVGKLRYRGLELAGGARVIDAIDLSANFTRLQAKNVTDPNSPVGDTYSRKAVFDAAWRPIGNRFSLGYTLRHNGEQKDVIVGSSAVGAVIPSFTVHDVRAQAALFERGRNRTSLMFGVHNLTDELYAEFANASFFRPEPRRSVSTALVVEF
ncbi:MAG TPA: TonB-dependent receptor [Gemmatimonadaceae bacterium]|nr:TonB-dependent receptor [Gemmatimonadaceae bacterium]